MTRTIAQHIRKACTRARHKAIATRFGLAAVLRPAHRYDGVRPLHIYGLRLVYVLMFFVLGEQTWTHILTHQGDWAQGMLSLGVSGRPLPR